MLKVNTKDTNTLFENDFAKNAFISEKITLISNGFNKNSSF